MVEELAKVFRELFARGLAEVGHVAGLVPVQAYSAGVERCVVERILCSAQSRHQVVTAETDE